MKKTRVWRDVTPEIFRSEIRPGGEPAILSGLVNGWEIVSNGRASAWSAGDYLAHHAAPRPVDFVVAPPESQGRLHYRDDMSGFTYATRSGGFAEILSALQREADQPHPATIAAQSLDVETIFPGLHEKLPFPLLDENVRPRIWVGNQAKVATHNDPLDNIACVVAGRRRFTLFPPEQIGNLYMGPLHVTPAGTPISMVHLTAADFGRYPKFRAALETAIIADLEVGDAIFIPYQWFHHVEALDPFNILINYWWNDARKDGGSPWDAMLHAIMAIRQLPPEQRRAWSAAFAHYVFLENGDPGEHLPEFTRGILAASSEDDIRAMKRRVLDALST